MQSSVNQVKLCMHLKIPERVSSLSCALGKNGHYKMLYFLPFWCNIRKSPLTAHASATCLGTHKSVSVLKWYWGEILSITHGNIFFWYLMILSWMSHLISDVLSQVRRTGLQQRCDF